MIIKMLWMNNLENVTVYDKQQRTQKWLLFLKMSAVFASVLQQKKRKKKRWTRLLPLRKRKVSNAELLHIFHTHTSLMNGK